MFVSTYFDQNYVLNVVLKHFTSCGEFMFIDFMLAKRSQFQQIRSQFQLIRSQFQLIKSQFQQIRSQFQLIRSRSDTPNTRLWTAALSLTQRCPRPNTYWYLEYMNIMPGLCWLNNKYKILYRVSWRLCQLAEFGLSICQHIYRVCHAIPLFRMEYLCGQLNMCQHRPFTVHIMTWHIPRSAI